MKDKPDPTDIRAMKDKPKTKITTNKSRFCKQCVHWNRHPSMPNTLPSAFGTCTHNTKAFVTKHGDDWCRYHMTQEEAENELTSGKPPQNHQDQDL